MTRNITESVDIIVEATGPFHAEEIAYSEARNNPNLDWEVDDCSGGRPYCPDTDEDIEEI